MKLRRTKTLRTTNNGWIFKESITFNGSDEEYLKIFGTKPPDLWQENPEKRNFLNNGKLIN